MDNLQNFNKNDSTHDASLFEEMLAILDFRLTLNISLQLSLSERIVVSSL